MVSKISHETIKFLKEWREMYRWPLSKGRVASEIVIEDYQRSAQIALVEKDSEKLKRVLIKIHKWKTGGRTTNLYRKTLNNKRELIHSIINYLPLGKRYSENTFSDLLDMLKIKQCNLPVSSAQASFLLDRRTPVLDRFVAQFFSRKISKNILKLKEWDLEKVFRDIKHVPFKIEDDGRGKCVPRLAVYNKSYYRKNKSIFVSLLLPELYRMTQILNKMDVYYQGIDSSRHNFNQVDVEMAIFAFGTQNRGYYQCFYEGRNIPTLNI